MEIKIKLSNTFTVVIKNALALKKTFHLKRAKSCKKFYYRRIFAIDKSATKRLRQSTILQSKIKVLRHKQITCSGVQTFHHQTFNHPTLNHDRVGDETLNHVSVRVRVRIRIRVIDSSPLAISSCYKVYVIRCLVIKCP